VVIEDRRRAQQWKIAGQAESVAVLGERLVQQGLFELSKDQFGAPCPTCLTYHLTARQGDRVRAIRVDTPPWIMASELPRELGQLRSTIAQLQMAIDSIIASNPPGEVHLPTSTPTPPHFAFGSPQVVGDMAVAVAAPLAVTELGGTPALRPERGRFLVVPLHVTNRSGAYQQLAASTTFGEGLMDSRGRRYVANAAASNRYAEQHGLLSLAFYKLASWEAVQGVLVFDVPADARGFRLTVRDADPAISNPPAAVLSLPEVQ
jgi:hypothetical protein